jgi:catechol 2,3-dioxygenase-like lactoylglutathione lyase family enzyme
MTSINSVTLEVNDPQAAEAFYAAAFDLDDRLRVRTSDAATSGFRGFTLSLVVTQPSTVNSLFDSAVAAGATVLKPVEKSLWGIGGVVQAPDGTVWTIATSEKKDTGPATREIDSFVLLLGGEDVGASKKFYVEHGLKVGKSFGSYVDFDMPTSPVKLGLYKRRALAKVNGISEEGTGSHRIAIGGDGGAFTDPNGYVWEATV